MDEGTVAKASSRRTSRSPEGGETVDPKGDEELIAGRRDEGATDRRKEQIKDKCSRSGSRRRRQSDEGEEEAKPSGVVKGSEETNREKDLRWKKEQQLGQQAFVGGMKKPMEVVEGLPEDRNATATNTARQ